MNLAQLSRYIEENRTFPTNLDESEIDLKNWIFVEDSDYNVYAIVKDRTLDYLSRFEEFRPIIQNILGLNELFTQYINLEELSMDEINEEDLELLQRLSPSYYTVVDMNNRDCYAFIIAIKKLNIRLKEIVIGDE